MRVSPKVENAFRKGMIETLSKLCNVIYPASNIKRPDSKNVISKMSEYEDERYEQV